MKSFRESIYKKTNGRCWYCGVVLPILSAWEIEHQVPKSQGGSDDRSNLVPSCRPCNIRKGKRTVEEYRHALMVRLESKITQAYELSEEFETYLAWPNGEPPAHITTISQVLFHASKLSVSTRLTFHGELDQYRERSTEGSSTEEAELPV